MSWSPYRNMFKQISHEAGREAKRDDAREGAMRLERIGNDLLNDGIAEAVAAHHDPEAYALPRDCEAEAYAMHESESERALDALRDMFASEAAEDRMADWEIALLTGMEQEDVARIAWSSVAYDQEQEMERSIKNERFRLSLEADEDDEVTDWHGSEVWPPACTMHDIEENHEFFSRGFTITTRP